MTTVQNDLLERARASVIIPVLVLDDPASAVPLALALRDAGLQMIEITLRTPGALAAIRAIRDAVPGLQVGAGTVTSPATVDAARAAGAQFAVSPGYTTALGRHCQALSFPLLPGAATATEVMVARDDGFDFLKFFPATACGGIGLLEALRGPFPDVSFCPTGGITAENAGDFLALGNVACVGGSWMAPRAAIRSQSWAEVTALAAQALQLLRRPPGGPSG